MQNGEPTMLVVGLIMFVVVFIMFTIERRKRITAEERVRVREHHHVTGLKNGHPFNEHLATAFGSGMKLVDAIPFLNGSDFSLLSPCVPGLMQLTVFNFDISMLSAFNDEQGGHKAGGDPVLIAFAQTMTACLLPGMTLYHIGGDEFMIIALCNHDEATAAVMQGLKAFRAQQPHPGSIYSLDASFGAVTLGEALWAYAAVVSQRPAHGRDQLTLLMKMAEGIADKRAYINKGVARALTGTRLYNTNMESYRRHGLYLFKGGHILPEHIEELAPLEARSRLTPENRELAQEFYEAVKTVCGRKYLNELAEHERRIAALVEIDGLEDIVQRILILSAMHRGPFELAA